MEMDLAESGWTNRKRNRLFYNKKEEIYYKCYRIQTSQNILSGK
jgi:hypothetical protein